jgi:hypothetical protein
MAGRQLGGEALWRSTFKNTIWLPIGGRGVVSKLKGDRSVEQRLEYPTVRRALVQAQNIKQFRDELSAMGGMNIWLESVGSESASSPVIKEVAIEYPSDRNRFYVRPEFFLGL